MIMGFGFGRTTATALAVFTLILLSVSSIFYVSGIPVLMELGAEGLFTFLLFATYFGHLKPYLQSGPREHVPNNQKLPSPRLAGRTGVKGLADGICLCPPPFGSVRKQCCAPVSVSRPCRFQHLLRVLSFDMFPHVRVYRSFGGVWLVVLLTVVGLCASPCARILHDVS